MLPLFSATLGVRSHRYRLKPQGGGLRTKVMRQEGWSMLLHDAKMIDPQFTLQDGTLVFLWSRMMTIDEIKVGAACVWKPGRGVVGGREAHLQVRG